MIENLVNYFNASVLMAFALVCLYIAVSDKFKTRIVITTGLGAITVGSGGMAVWLYVGADPWDLSPFNRAISLLNAGIVTVICGYVWGVLKAHRVPRRRRTDWVELDEHEQRHVAGGSKQ